MNEDADRIQEPSPPDPPTWSFWGGAQESRVVLPLISCEDGHIVFPEFIEKVMVKAVEKVVEKVLRDRFKQCAAGRCRNFFWDLSDSGTRRYCSGACSKWAHRQRKGLAHVDPAMTEEKYPNAGLGGEWTSPDLNWRGEI